MTAAQPSNAPLNIAITTGEPAGVGPELTAQALAAAGAHWPDAHFTVLGDSGLMTERLRIKEAVAQTASTLRRFTPKARGSAGPILKRSCHIKIVLTDQ